MMTADRIGKQAMNGGPLVLRDGKWAEGPQKPRCCQLCKAPSLYYDRDNVRCTVMTCDDCGGMEIITKGSGHSGWWYHGARQPHEWPKRFIDMLDETP